jgi:hypothetical protein
VIGSPPLNDLAGLSRVNLQQRLLNMMTGRGEYPDPLSFQVTTAARLLDKALDAWDSAREKLAGHISGASPRRTPLQQGTMYGVEDWSRRPSQELFRAIDRFEDVVDSLARLLRLLEAIEANQRVPQVPAPAFSLATRNDVRIFRNRIAHGDEDLVDGRAGKALSTATLAVDSAGIEIQRVCLEYTDLEAMLTEAHDYLQRLIAP